MIVLRFHNDFIMILLGFKASRGFLGGPGRSQEVLGSPAEDSGGPRKS